MAGDRERFRSSKAAKNTPRLTHHPIRFLLWNGLERISSGLVGFGRNHARTAFNFIDVFAA